MNEITYLVSFKSTDKFNNIDSGHCAAVLEKGNYTEHDLTISSKKSSTSISGSGSLEVD